MYSKVKVCQSCPTLCNPMDYSLPGSSVHGISQARILEWAATSFSRRSSWSPALQADSLPSVPPGNPGFYTAKGTINKTKTILRMGGNICKWSNKWRVNLQNTQTIHSAQHQKKKKNLAKDLNSYFFKEDIQMAKSHMKRCSVSPLEKCVSEYNWFMISFCLITPLVQSLMGTPCSPLQKAGLTPIFLCTDSQQPRDLT